LNLQLKELYSNSKSKATSNRHDSFHGTKHSFFKSDNLDELETRDMVQTARMIKDTYDIHQSDDMKELKFVSVCVLFNLFGNVHMSRFDLLFEVFLIKHEPEKTVGVAVRLSELAFYSISCVLDFLSFQIQMMI